MKLTILLLLSISILLCLTIAQKKSDIDTTNVYLLVESMPTMSNGLDINDGGFFSFFTKEFRCPENLICGIERITFEFTVMYNGKIANKNILYSKDCPADYELIKNAGIIFLNKLECKPGKNNGHYVNVRYKIPVRICMQRR